MRFTIKTKLRYTDTLNHKVVATRACVVLWDVRVAAPRVGVRHGLRDRGRSRSPEHDRNARTLLHVGALRGCACAKQRGRASAGREAGRGAR